VNWFLALKFSVTFARCSPYGDMVHGISCALVADSTGIISQRLLALVSCIGFGFCESSSTNTLHISESMGAACATSSSESESKCSWQDDQCHAKFPYRVRVRYGNDASHAHLYGVNSVNCDLPSFHLDRLMDSIWPAMPHYKNGSIYYGTLYDGFAQKFFSLLKDQARLQTMALTLTQVSSSDVSECQGRSYQMARIFSRYDSTRSEVEYTRTEIACVQGDLGNAVVNGSMDYLA
jgi:hypothetical protein